mmetsp:Transcript_63087/g.148583  ORF Transcript_63087/g.148583 Transcript_63087/m.148583 type:complete len:467 (-) Transcript_63087:743-2143(-)
MLVQLRPHRRQRARHLRLVVSLQNSANVAIGPEHFLQLHKTLRRRRLPPDQLEELDAVRGDLDLDHHVWLRLEVLHHPLPHPLRDLAPRRRLVLCATCCCFGRGRRDGDRLPAVDSEHAVKLPEHLLGVEVDHGAGLDQLEAREDLRDLERLLRRVGLEQLVQLLERLLEVVNQVAQGTAAAVSEAVGLVVRVVGEDGVAHGLAIMIALERHEPLEKLRAAVEILEPIVAARHDPPIHQTGHRRGSVELSTPQTRLRRPVDLLDLVLQRLGLGQLLLDLGHERPRHGEIAVEHVGGRRLLELLAELFADRVELVLQRLPQLLLRRRRALLGQHDDRLRVPALHRAVERRHLALRRGRAFLHVPAEHSLAWLVVWERFDDLREHLQLLAPLAEERVLDLLGDVLLDGAPEVVEKRLELRHAGKEVEEVRGRLELVLLDSQGLELLHRLPDRLLQLLFDVVFDRRLLR